MAAATAAAAFSAAAAAAAVAAGSAAAAVTHYKCCSLSVTSQMLKHSITMNCDSNGVCVGEGGGGLTIHCDQRPKHLRSIT